MKNRDDLLADLGRFSEPALATPVFYSIFDDLRGTDKMGELVRRWWPKPKREKSLEEAA